MSKLIRAVEKIIPKALSLPEPIQVPVQIDKHWDVPLDVRTAIIREAEREPSDPFVARRLLAHYRSGMWSPADARSK